MGFVIDGRVLCPLVGRVLGDVGSSGVEGNPCRVEKLVDCHSSARVFGERECLVDDMDDGGGLQAAVSFAGYCRGNGI